MARPTSKHRLRDLDPDDFGRIIAKQAESDITRLMVDTRDDAVRSIVHQNTTEIAKEASLLAAYARDGGNVDRATGALSAVRIWLYSAAIHAPMDVIERISLVILATYARFRLDRKKPLPVRELACLAGVDPAHVRHLAREGEIAIADGTVASRIAKKWLVARGVKL